MLSVQHIDGSSMPCVYKEDWHGYTAGWHETLTKFSSSTSVALNPYLVLSPSPTQLDAPKVMLSRRCFLKTSAAPLVNERNKNFSNRVAATLAGLYFISYPYLHTHRTFALRNHSACFAAMDAVLDDNGEIALVPPADFRRASVLTTLHETKIIENKEAQIGKLSIISGILVAGAVLLVRTRPNH